MLTAPQPRIRRLRAGRISRRVGSFINATTQALAASQRWYRPRFLAHAGLITLAALAVSANDQATSHSVAVRLMSSQSGIGGTLDGATVASLSADVATSNQLMIVSEASRTATKKNEQVALLSTTDDTLAKRQVVSTAGTATRDIQKYSVTAGDTLSTIASKFGITTATIKWANDLDDADFVKPGQQLTILPVSGLLYTVSALDTPEALAKTYQANAAQILSYNNAELKGLSRGQQIIIPDGIKPAPERPVATLASTRGTVAGASTSRVSAPTLTRYVGSGGGYAYGYCTYYVALRRSVPGGWGNANTWYYNAQASGFRVGSVPVAGAIAWTGAGYYGHVAYVEGVSGNMVTISEMNYNGGWNRVTSRTVPASSFRYIY